MSDSYVLSSVANSIEHLANSIQFQNHLFCPWPKLVKAREELEAME